MTTMVTCPLSELLFEQRMLVNCLELTHGDIYACLCLNAILLNGYRAFGQGTVL